jgi:hypothetical protein
VVGEARLAKWEPATYPAPRSTTSDFAAGIGSGIRDDPPGVAEWAGESTG